VRHNSWRATKNYHFNGQVVAMRKNGVLSYLHGDHLGSTVATSNSSGNFSGQEWYHAYGRYRGGHELGSENRFTGQKLDATGLMYYNARYYDPELGQFLSPDTIVPDPTNLLDYNRYMYVRGNPMKYTDPTGHWLESALDIISLGATVKDINDNGLNWENGIGLAADVVSLAAPGVAGGGTVVRYADDAYAASKAGVNAAWDWGKRALGYGDEAAQYGDETASAAKAGADCLTNSFSADTLVMTPSGLKAISELVEGELVLAYNEATGQIGAYPITDVISHVDAEIVLLTIDGETLETTAEHPFYELEAVPGLAVGQYHPRWTDANELKAGDLVWQADGTTGAVQSIAIVAREQRMYNLTVAEAHTFFVGEQQWLVHNAGPCGAKGLIGKDFEGWLSKNLGGSGSFSVGGREFDGAIGNRWYEAKSGQYWDMLQNNSKEYNKFLSDMGSRLKIAQSNNATYELHSNTQIPQGIKDWLTNRGIQYFEHLE
jgi:RHS repeat-associated protein